MTRTPQRYLVVARYNEDVSWTKDVPPGWTVLLYNKGLLCSNPIENFPGREAHTYLLAITTNYNTWFKGETEIVFCQGNPFDHCPDFLDRLDTGTEFGPDWRCDPDGGSDWSGAMLDEFCGLFGLPKQCTYRFTAGAQFKVTGEQIHRHPLALYRAMLAMAEMPDRPDWKNKSAWRFERIWATLFRP